MLNHIAYPHVVDHIIALAPRDSLLVLRRTCRALRDLVDARMARHLVLKPWANLTTPEGRHPAIRLDKGLSALSPASQAHMSTVLKSNLVMDWILGSKVADNWLAKLAAGAPIPVLRIWSIGGVGWSDEERCDDCGARTWWPTQSKCRTLVAFDCIPPSGRLDQLCTDLLSTSLPFWQFAAERLTIILDPHNPWSFPALRHHFDGHEMVLILRPCERAGILYKHRNPGHESWEDELTDCIRSSVGWVVKKRSRNLIIVNTDTTVPIPPPTARVTASTWDLLLSNDLELRKMLPAHRAVAREANEFTGSLATFMSLDEYRTYLGDDVQFNLETDDSYTLPI